MIGGVLIMGIYVYDAFDGGVGPGGPVPFPGGEFLVFHLHVS